MKVPFVVFYSKKVHQKCILLKAYSIKYSTSIFTQKLLLLKYSRNFVLTTPRVQHKMWLLQQQLNNSIIHNGRHPPWLEISSGVAIHLLCFGSPPRLSNQTLSVLKRNQSTNISQALPCGLFLFLTHLWAMVYRL